MASANNPIRALILGLSCLISALATAAQYQVPHSTVTFDAPDGYTPLSAQEIRFKFPSGGGPGFAVGNERRTTTIAYELKRLAVSDDELANLLPGIAGQMEKAIPGLMWVDKRVITLDGRHGNQVHSPLTSRESNRPRSPC
jgi:hypothetical protein